MNLSFAIWSLAAVPVIAALYIIGFLFKKNGLGKYYPLPKCAASFLCAGGAALGCVFCGYTPSLSLLFWALMLCTAGDFLIEYHLIAGGMAFGAAHCLIMLYVLSKAPPRPGAFILWAAILVLFLLVFRPQLPRMGKLLVPFLLYCAVLTGGFSLAVFLPFSMGISFLLLPLGLFSFLLSDMILGKRHFGSKKPYLSECLMALYYLAVYLISATLWFT